MRTHALDLATIAVCLERTEGAVGIATGPWTPQSKEQRRVLELYGIWRNVLRNLTDIVAKTTIVWDATHTIGTVTVETTLDKLVQWVDGRAGPVTVFGANQQRYPGFKLTKSGYNIRKTKQGTLVQALTSSDTNLWLFLPREDLAPAHGIAMVEMASGLMQEWQSSTPASYEEAHVPMMDFRLKPNIMFLGGLSIRGTEGSCTVVQASQDFRMRMDQQGARVKVQTYMRSQLIGAAMRTLPRILVFDRPFYGWYAQTGISIPLAVFYGDYDSWRKPAGSLAEL